MRQIPLGQVSVEPGLAWAWHLLPVGRPITDRILSYNQVRYLRSGGGSSISGTFEVDGPVDLAEMEAAFGNLLQRHPVLRFTPQGEYPQMRLHRVSHGWLGSPDVVHRYLKQQFAELDPVYGPLVGLGALVRERSTTVHLCLDHLVGDVVSVVIAMAELVGTYRQVSPPSFFAYSQEEHQRNEALDERLSVWREFARDKGFFPESPVVLGPSGGDDRNEVVELLSAAECTDFERRCRSAGGGMMSGLLAAMATAQRDEGGPDVYRAFVALNQRGERYAGSLGWFVNVVPIEIPVPRPADLDQHIRTAQAAYRRARSLKEVHYIRAWELLAPSTRFRAVNFFSYLDFRDHQQGDVSNPAIQVNMPGRHGLTLWLYRNEQGLYLHWIYRDTAVARTSTAALARRLREILREPGGRTPTSSVRP
ncbi:condensation domain-containing protein [Kineosporia babensis]|uniref:Condensation domain-containing protein n=1 Tax=Kineosporia babensis TaxID=499548 RepID=A0A9X1NJ78_9ACTN|nr:condensation domain-containing protein [Kineosporia babensis]MCD5316022.1 condensation domain-containing protein [Kineosporia babensis]